MNVSDMPTTQAPEGALSFAMVAGEVSGDLLAAQLMSGLQTRWPQAQGWGIGSADQGFRCPVVVRAFGGARLF